MNTKGILFPKANRILKQVGENIKLARLRRNMSAKSLSERAGISRGTMLQIELGAPSVSIGLYMQVMFILSLENDFLNLAKDDILGRKLQDAGLTIKKRTSKIKAEK